jgi:hypothetical protein
LAEMMAITALRDLFLHLQTCLGKSCAFVTESSNKRLSLPSDEICTLSFALLLIYYLYNFNLHEIMKLKYFPATYNVAVKYMICKTCLALSHYIFV